MDKPVGNKDYPLSDRQFLNKPKPTATSRPGWVAPQFRSAAKPTMSVRDAKTIKMEARREQSREY